MKNKKDVILNSDEIESIEEVSTIGRTSNMGPDGNHDGSYTNLPAVKHYEVTFKSGRKENFKDEPDMNVYKGKFKTGKEK